MNEWCQRGCKGDSLWAGWCSPAPLWSKVSFALKWICPSNTHPDLTWVLMVVVRMIWTVTYITYVSCRQLLQRFYIFPWTQHCGSIATSPTLGQRCGLARPPPLLSGGSPGRIRYLTKMHRTFQTELLQSHLSRLSHADVWNEHTRKRLICGHV